MYKCIKCGEVFETPDSYEEDMNGEGAYETFYQSPCCHDSYYEVYECNACHVNYTDNECCEECISDVNKAMKIAVDMFIEKGIDKDAIYDLIEGWLENV